MIFTTKRLVEFQHCDPAAMVFYPRYFEMINSVVEEFFREVISYGFAHMHSIDNRGVPTGRIAVEFHHPSRLEDPLDFTLSLTRLGTASVDFALLCTCQAQPRFTASLTLVRNDTTTGKSDPWPEDLREKLTFYLEEQP